MKIVTAVRIENYNNRRFGINLRKGRTYLLRGGAPASNPTKRRMRLASLIAYAAVVAAESEGRRRQLLRFVDPYHATVCAQEGEVCSCDDGLVTFGSIKHLGKVGDYTSVPMEAPGGSIECEKKNFGMPLSAKYDQSSACVCHRHDTSAGPPPPLLLPAATTPSDRGVSSSRSARNLLFVDAVGPEERRLRIVEANVRLLAREPAWDCMVSVYATEEELPTPRLARVAEVCRVHRSKHVKWGSFLRLLDPLWIQHYDKVAVLLDDVALPEASWLRTKEGGEGDCSPSARSHHHHHAHVLHHMVEAMDRSGMDVYSPAVREAHAPVMWPVPDVNCLKRAHGIEIFFTIFRADAWTCFYDRVVEEDNSGGCGYDLCLHKACPELKIAVDHRFRASHCLVAKSSQKQHQHQQAENPCEWQGQLKLCGVDDLVWMGGQCEAGTGTANMTAVMERANEQQIAMQRAASIEKRKENIVERKVDKPVAGGALNVNELPAGCNPKTGKRCRDPATGMLSQEVADFLNRVRVKRKQKRKEPKVDPHIVLKQRRERQRIERRKAKSDP